MKRILLIILSLQIANFCLFAQEIGANQQLELFKKKNREVVSLFKARKFKEAQKVAVEALDLSRRVYGEENAETATSCRNLGEVLRMRKKYKEAITNFDRALAIYQTRPKQNADRILGLLESKGTAFAFSKKKKDAKRVFAQRLLFAEQVFGKDSEKILPYLKTQTDFYLYVKDFDNADQMFIRRQIISAKNNGKLQSGYMQDDIVCYLHQNLSSRQIVARQ